MGRKKSKHEPIPPYGNEEENCKKLRGDLANVEEMFKNGSMDEKQYKKSIGDILYSMKTSNCQIDPKYIGFPEE